MKKQLTIELLIESAKEFCIYESKYRNNELYGVTDGKAVGTFIEQKFKTFLLEKFEVIVGNSASGIDLPTKDINTDIKVTSIKQPQSSCPFKDAKQKIFGLGYNLLVFVYDKKDDLTSETTVLDFVSCSFIDEEQTADYTTTYRLCEMVKDKANTDDIVVYLHDKNIPADDITLIQLAEQILDNPPSIGYLTISNALQWKLQYGRIVHFTENVNGITKIIDKISIHENI